MVIEPDGDIVVIGVGNRYRSDDGIGHRVLDELATEVLVAESHPQPSRLPRVRLCWSDGEAARLIEEWRGAELAVVVDAVVAGDEPGKVRVFEAGVEDLPVRPGTSSHATGVGEAWALAGALDARPGRLVVVGVEPAVLDDGTELTPMVSAAVPCALRLVRTALAMAPTHLTAHHRTGPVLVLPRDSDAPAPSEPVEVIHLEDLPAVADQDPTTQRGAVS